MKNQKGFTLVELLAVIVILAVVMLIGVTAIGPIVTRSQQSALRTEAIQMVEAAKLAYQFEQGYGHIKSNESVCFKLEDLKTHQYYEKGASEDYYGSVLVTYNNGNYTYSVWATNSVYGYKNLVSTDQYKIDNKIDDPAEAGTNNNYAAYTNCGGKTPYSFS